MADVNPQEALRPTLRQERAGVTRRRILDAARHLFFRDGYAATTLRAVALEAGVAVQTVYVVFGSKAAILAELRSMAVSQPDADAALGAAMTSAAPDDRLRAFAHSIRLRWEHAGDIVKVHEDAVRVDPSIREGISAADARRTAGITAFVTGLDTAFDLGLDVARAVAVVHALTLFDLYAELVSRQGWTADAYERWLADTLVAGVLAST